MKKIKKILVANRGEIALRIFKTCKEMNIATVAIYIEEEKKSLYVRTADEKISLGDGTLRESFLNAKRIIEIAKEVDADAIHPGYGFLSENASFSEAVEKAGLIFIGPTKESIQMMGDKVGSKVKMQKLKIPVIPGYHGDEQTPSKLISEAAKIGLPLLIKASAGGGGKGMRIVESLDQFENALNSAKREAMNAFGDDRMLLERYLTSPRHIEIQMMSDTHGNHFHFFERECSIQRRHQKIVEESPSFVLTPSDRQKICDVAVKITSAMNYRGAGTIEFIYDTDGSFYFLEMNTRLQVEHPVTEMVTGFDLVKLQIEVAQGEKLNFTQKDITQRGHAIEVRVCAEDPENEFLPSVGKLLYLGDPTSSHVRLESALTMGDEITINFDPMLAKVVAFGMNRSEATVRLIGALETCAFLGFTTNCQYLMQILKTPAFKKGATYTHFVKTYKEEINNQKIKLNDSDKALILGLSQIPMKKSVLNKENTIDTNSWDTLRGFRLY